MKKIWLILLCPLLLPLGTAMAQTQTMETDMNIEQAQTALSAKQYAFANIAALTASGNTEALKIALNNALDNGVSVNEIKDVMVQLYAYCGFPRSLNALATLHETLEQRRQQGKATPEGRLATPLPADTDILQLGTATQTKLVGAPVNIALSADIDRYLKTHLFGDIFASDLLDWQEREIVTVAALASMPGVEPQLNAHFNISRNTGISEAQLHAIVDVVGRHNRTLGDNAKRLLNQQTK
ncbi:MAG: carboxymuconolactone decarboxylase family protein [Neisseria sp.]|nr:carboxymuconolactone decarboxylase family protein [Neisseria sp.]